MSWNVQLTGHREYPSEDARLEEMDRIEQAIRDLFPLLKENGLSYGILSHNTKSVDLLKEAPNGN